MTEQQWRECRDPVPMLAFLRGKAGERELRLFVCACARALFGLNPDARSRRAVKVAERYADGEVSAEKLRHAWGDARRAVQAYGRAVSGPAGQGEAFALWAAMATTVAALSIYPGQAGVNWYLSRNMNSLGVQEPPPDEAGILRDLFGPFPFRPVIQQSEWLAWNDGIVPKLARAIYEDRAFDRMPVLGDALEEAGCDDADILTHCRAGGEHVRGCWVVDLVMGKR